MSFPRRLLLLTTFAHTYIHTYIHTYMYTQSDWAASNVPPKMSQIAGAQQSSESPCLSVCLSPCLSICLSVCPSPCLSVCLSACLYFVRSLASLFVYVNHVFIRGKKWGKSLRQNSNKTDTHTRTHTHPLSRMYVCLHLYILSFQIMHEHHDFFYQTWAKFWKAHAVHTCSVSNSTYANPWH